MTGGCWWSRDIAAAQQQHFFSFQLVLPNGRAEEKKFVEGSAALVESIKEINETMNEMNWWN